MGAQKLQIQSTKVLFCTFFLLLRGHTANQRNLIYDIATHSHLPSIEQVHTQAKMADESKSGEMFQAVRVNEFGDSSVLVVETREPFAAVEAGQVLVRMAFAGVNPVDTCA